MKKLLTILLIASIIGGCSMCNQKKEVKEKLFEDIDPTDTSSTQITKERVSSIIRSIPSPLELSIMIKKSGATFNKQYLHKTKKVDDYTSNFEKAVNLGIYGTDLGYLLLYKQTHEAVNQLEAVRKLARDLKVEHFFDFNTIHRLTENQGNSDSLIYITTSGFGEMSDYLKKQNRSALSVLMLTGGWIEGLHIATQAAIKTDNQKLMKRVGEQKLTLNEILILCGGYRNNDKLKSLYKSLKKLQTAFQGVTISYKKGETKQVEKGSTIVVKDMSKSVVQITPKQLQKIAEQTNIIRNKLI